tara:strand:+ start:15132 stop:16355 length:1224 start_codon:yes stop_codon:yes gene_type:complete
MKSYSHTYDVVIIGDGLVGLSSALGLAQYNLSVAVIEAAPLPAISPLHFCAINPASERMLSRLGVWNLLDTQKLSPYQSMHIWEKGGIGNLKFDGTRLGEETIGHIVESMTLQRALRHKILEVDNVTLISGKATNIGFGEREAWLTLEDLSHLSARLVVAADGSESWVRERCRIPMSFWDHGRVAITATIRTELAHGFCTRQAFLEEGPLAFLPLTDPNMCSISWSTTHQKATELRLCSEEDFNRHLTLAFDGRLGSCDLISERHTSVMKMRYSRHFARHRLVLVGDAAHTIHPLAGQGVNLGFIDSAALTQEVGRITLAKKDIGLLPMLREYERWRKADAVKMIGVMEVFNQFYQGVSPLKKMAKDIGMNLLDNIPEMKEQFLLHAMGNKGELPELCQLHYKDFSL